MSLLGHLHSRRREERVQTGENQVLCLHNPDGSCALDVPCALPTLGHSSWSQAKQEAGEAEQS